MNKIIDLILELTHDWSFGKTLLVLVVVLTLLMWMKVELFF